MVVLFYFVKVKHSPPKLFDYPYIFFFFMHIDLAYCQKSHNIQFLFI